MVTAVIVLGGIAALGVALLIGTRITSDGSAIEVPARLDRGSLASMTPPARMRISSELCEVVERLPGAGPMRIRRADVAVVRFHDLLTLTVVTFEDPAGRLVDRRRVRINRLQRARVEGGFEDRGWIVATVVDGE